MSYYNEINNLLKKYDSKQPAERWSSKTKKKYEKIKDLNKNLRLFDGINSEYFQLKGSQIDRAKYLIKKLNFNEICGRCSSEQIIVMICFFVKCEYYRNYSRTDCAGVLRKYSVSAYLLDRFMVHLVKCGLNNTI